MTHEEYVKSLGYRDLDRHVFRVAGVEDEIPEFCHVLAKWPNESVTAHFSVPNTVIGFFDAFDEVGDPTDVCAVWCCDADDQDVYLDTDDDSIEWPLK